MSLAELFYAKHPRRIHAQSRSTARTRRRASRLLFEPLEKRLLLSADVSLAPSTLDPPLLLAPAVVLATEPPPAPTVSLATDADPPITTAAKQAIVDGLHGLQDWAASKLDTFNEFGKHLPIVDKAL